MHVKIVAKSEKSNDLEFWLKKTPEERINAVEFLRSQYYVLAGYESTPKFVPSLKIRRKSEYPF